MGLKLNSKIYLESTRPKIGLVLKIKPLGLMLGLNLCLGPLGLKKLIGLKIIIIIILSKIFREIKWT